MRGSSFPFTDLSGGVDYASAPYQVDTNRARDALNMITTGRGAARKRQGCRTLASSQGAIHSLHPIPDTGTLPPMLVAATDEIGVAQLIRINPDGTKVTLLDSSLTLGARWSFVHAPAGGGQGPIYGANGVDQPQQYDGTSGFADWTASAGTVPNGRFLAFVGNRVFVAGTTAERSRLYASNLKDPRDWNTAIVGGSYAVDLDRSDGDRLTGMGASLVAYGGVASGQLVVFKRRKTYLITNLDTGANQLISAGIGCGSHRSIAVSERGLFFMSSDDGVFLIPAGRAQLQRISAPIEPLLHAIPQDQLDLCAGVYADGHYYLTISPTLTLDYDVQAESWWPHSIGAHQWAVWPDGDPDGKGLFFAAATPIASRPIVSGQHVVSEAFVPELYTDNGETFAGGSFWKGSWHTFGSPHIRKRVREVRFDGSGHVQASFAKDFAPEAVGRDVDFRSGDVFFGGEVGDFGGLGLFGEDPSVSQATALNLGVGRVWSVGFANQTAEPFSIESYTIAAQMEKN